MGESGGGSLTGPRLHRLQEFQEDFKMTAGGAWRRPRMKVYDYNQEFGGNYYQPMIQYINHKDIYGPFSKKADVYLPHSAEVTSAKYTNMRYNDKSSAKHNLDQFLVDAHKTQIKELNGTTAMARVNLMKNIVTSRRQPHTPLDNVNTPYNPIRLLKGAPPGQEAVNHYISELSIVKTGNHKLDTKYRKHLAMVEACEDEYDYHHKLFGQGAVDRDFQFHNPQLVKDYANQMRAALRMTTLLICNLAKFIQLKDDGHEDSADLLCDRLPIVLLARYRLHNQLCNFKHLCSASKLYKSYSIE